MKNRKIALTMILICAPVLLFACATAKSQYEAAREINTIPVYQEFLSKYPSGEYAQLARTRIEAINFEKAQAVNSVEAYEDFLQSSNSDLFKTYAIQRIQSIYSDAYSKAKETNTVDAYEHYLRTYPKSEYVPDCLAGIEDLEWSRALKRHGAIGYYQYLNDCRVCEKYDQAAQRRFVGAVKSGAVVDLELAKDKIEQILGRSDIVVVRSEADKISTKTGSAGIDDLSSANEVLVSILKEERKLSVADLAAGNYESVKTLRLRNRVPTSDQNPIGFSTIIFFTPNGVTEFLFVEEGKGYLFKDTD